MLSESHEESERKPGLYVINQQNEDDKDLEPLIPYSDLVTIQKYGSRGYEGEIIEEIHSKNLREGFHKALRQVTSGKPVTRFASQHQISQPEVGENLFAGKCPCD